MMKKYFSILSIIFLIAIPVLHAQQFIPDRKTDIIICGFDQAISGESIPYFSCYEDYATDALLTRCTDGNKTIEWLTAPLPEKIKGQFVYFNWVSAHSTGTSKGNRQFDLYVNDKFALTFTTYPSRYDSIWSFAAADSTRLSFEFKTKDRYNDAHGIAWLRLPASLCTPGLPVKLKVIGHNQNSPDWYMTFKFSFEEQLNAELLPFILKSNDVIKKQPLLITALHFGWPEKALITIKDYKNESRQFEFNVKEGINVFEIPIAACDTTRHLYVNGNIGNKKLLEKVLHQHPVKPYSFCLIHHSHNDIGYSHLQTEVEKIQNKNIYDALRMIDKTQLNDYKSSFKWNIESLWAVDNFLHQCDAADSLRFVDAVRKQKIGLSAFYANVLTGLSTSEECNWIMEYADSLRHQLHLKTNVAMFTDIPGMSWNMVSAMTGNGVRYLSIGENYMEGLPDNGDRIGSSLKTWGDKPFWWKSISGKDSIMVWMGAKGYSSWHRFDKGKIFTSGYRKIAQYVNELDSTNYPYQMVQWRYNIVSDNGPVDTTISDFVKQWNEKYSAPVLELTEVNNLFSRFDSVYGKQLPTYSGDFTPYWEDGAYSTAFEEGQNRLLSRKISQLEKLSSTNNQCRNLLYNARRCVVMFHEHTWGSWCSISQPDDSFTTEQWHYKKLFVDSAQFYVDAVESILNEKHLKKTQIVTVFNTLDFIRSAYVEIKNPLHSSVISVRDEEGHMFPAQKTDNGNILFYANEIPAKGSKQFYLSDAAIKIRLTDSISSNAKIDTVNACLSEIALINKQTLQVQTEVKADKLKSGFDGLFQMIYVDGLDVSKFVKGKLISVTQTEFGPFRTSYRMVSKVQGCDSVVTTISSYANRPILKVSVLIAKKTVREKEGVHIVLPFSIVNPELAIAFDNELMNPVSGQLAGSNKDFLSVDNLILIKNDSIAIGIASPQGALFEPEQMTDEQRLNNGYKLWRDKFKPSATLFSYVMNNYWHTNYKADQSGLVQFDYYIMIQKKFNQKQMLQFAEDCNYPLLSY